MSGPGLGRTFWNTDLKDIEATFLNGKVITQLPAYHSAAVPGQGSVLLEAAIDIEREMAVRPQSSRPSLFGRLKTLLRN